MPTSDGRDRTPGIRTKVGPRFPAPAPRLLSARLAAHEHTILLEYDGAGHRLMPQAALRNAVELPGHVPPVLPLRNACALPNGSGFTITDGAGKTSTVCKDFAWIESHPG